MSSLRNNLICLSGRLFEPPIMENSLSLSDFFALAAENRFGAVELRDSQITPDATDKAIESVLQLVEAYNLPVAMLTARQGRLNNEKGFRRFLDYLQLAVKLHCPQIKVSGSNIALLHRAAEVAENFGIKIGSNNHIGTEWETLSGTLRMIRDINHRNFFCHFDPSHLWLNRQDISADNIAELLRYISYFIIQDYVEGCDDDYQVLAMRQVRSCAIGDQGAVGYPVIAAMLAAAGYQGPAALVFARDVVQNKTELGNYCRELLGEGKGI